MDRSNPPFHVVFQVDPLRAAASSLKETMGDGNELTKDNLELAVKVWFISLLLYHAGNSYLYI